MVSVRCIYYERIFVAATVQPVLQSDSSVELEKQKRRLRETCDEFESVMVSYMMKTMRDSTMRAEEPGNAMGMFEDMLAGQVSKQVSHSSSLGVGDLLYSKLEPLVKIHGQKEAHLAPSKAQTAVSAKQAENPGGD
jgi:Rod binding domain-containing protein